MRIEYKNAQSGPGIGCWIWGALIVLLIGSLISFFFNFFFVSFPLLGVALVGYWIYAVYRGKKRRQAQMEAYQNQFEGYYQQGEQPQQQTPPSGVIDADYRVVDDAQYQENE